MTEPRQLVLLSGKGGTGKTSIAASFASLAAGAVVADCDVDAADLHLILSPQVRETHEFIGGRKARIDQEACTSCGACRLHCRFQAITDAGPNVPFAVDPAACEGCGVCRLVCPAQAVEFRAHCSGEWFVSRTRVGPLVHARLGVAEENSGKLVALVRAAARRLAEEEACPLIIIDGPPGIGCPVIASLTGADFVLAVTEPTLSGLHDLQRVTDLARHFGIPTAVSVNKHDLNPDMTGKIEAWSAEHGVLVLGRIAYDRDVTMAQAVGLSVVEFSRTGAALDVRRLWEQTFSAAGVPGNAVRHRDAPGGSTHDR